MFSREFSFRFFPKLCIHVHVHKTTKHMRKTNKHVHETTIEKKKCSYNNIKWSKFGKVKLKRSVKNSKQYIRRYSYWLFLPKHKLELMFSSIEPCAPRGRTFPATFSPLFVPQARTRIPAISYQPMIR